MPTTPPLAERLNQTDASHEDVTPDMLDCLTDSFIGSLPSSLRALQETRHPRRFGLMHEILVRVLAEQSNVTILADELPSVLVDAWIEEERHPSDTSREDGSIVSYRHH